MSANESLGNGFTFLNLEFIDWDLGFTMRETVSVYRKAVTRELPCVPGKALALLDYSLEFQEN